MRHLRVLVNFVFVRLDDGRAVSRSCHAGQTPT